MGIKVIFEIHVCLAYLKDKLINVQFIKDAIVVYQTATNPLDQVRGIAGIAESISEAVQWNIIQGMGVQAAINIAATAIDKLFRFEGNVFGVIPVGGAIEAYDDALARLVLNMAYEKIRDRKNLTKDQFNSAVSKKFAS